MGYKYILAVVVGCVAFVQGIKWDVYSTKTAYEWAHPMNDPVTDAEYEKTDGSDTCKAVHIYMVVRHGSRYPTGSSTDEINEFREHIVDSTSGEYLEQIQNWTSLYNHTYAEHLAPSGEQEQFDIGRRVGIKLHTLLSRQKQNLKFVSSTKDRNIDSNEHLYRGLTDAVTDISAFENELNATLMRFYDDCKNYEDQVEDNTTHMAEFTKFEQDTDFIAVAEKLMTGLGFSTPLTMGKCCI